MCYNLGLFTFLTLICVYVCVVRTGHGSCVEVTRQFAVPSFHLWFWVKDGMTSSGEVTVPSSPVALSRQSQFFNSGNRICLIHYNNVIWIAHTTHTHTHHRQFHAYQLPRLLEMLCFTFLYTCVGVWRP